MMKMMMTPQKSSGKKSPVARGIEPNDWSEVLHLKSGDNEKASYIYNTINNKLHRTISWVSPKKFIFHLQVMTSACTGKKPWRIKFMSQFMLFYCLQCKNQRHFWLFVHAVLGL